MKVMLAVLISSLLAKVSLYSDYALLSPRGIAARLDIVNSLKIALKLCHPKPTKNEREAAIVFTEFLSTSAMDEYLDVFYANSETTKINSFMSFLNGFLYNGNSDLPAWHAAEILSRMMKTKVNLNKIEILREKAKENNKKISRSVPTARKFNYTEILRAPRIFQLGPLLEVVKKELGHTEI